MKFIWWSWASGYQTNLSLCFVGTTTTRLIWCGKNSTVRQKLVARQFFSYFRGSGFLQFFSVATPAKPRGEKKIVQILGGGKLLKFVESAGEIFLSGLRGANIFSNTFRIVFRVFFSRFSSLFSYRFQSFLGGQFRSADMPP